MVDIMVGREASLLVENAGNCLKFEEVRWYLKEYLQSTLLEPLAFIRCQYS
jgi:hypothetical protein